MLSLTLVSLLLSSLLPARVAASPCIAMDTSFNLLVFGVDGKDYNAGTQNSWTSGSASDVTAANRPPFDGTNTTCFLSQFYNAVYVLNGDASNPTAVYIYDAGGKTWSKQSVTAPPGEHTFDPSNFETILDHDTNVFYAMSKGEIFFLDMGSLTAANSSALTWTDVGAPQAWGDLSSYSPTMALAQNHIHFIGVPRLQPGEADIFVIHFSYFQPEAQSYGSDFPQTHGQTASFFQNEGVQQEFAFIPDDGSATYVINVENNSTQKLAGPSVKDAGAQAQYFAGVTSLVQLSPSQGSLQFLPYTQGSDNSAASWTKITSVTVPAGSGSSNSNSTPTASAGGPRGTASSTRSGAQASSSGASSGVTRTVMTSLGSIAGAVAFAVLLL